MIALQNVATGVLEKYAYDPWGARRNPTNWTLKDTRTTFIVNRGYTGHEHIDVLGIINMNGRVYDPATAQFYSPDPQLQSPGNWLNYNRYAYCLSNPFKYTDPSGEFLVFAIIGAAIINGIIQGDQTQRNGGNFWEGALQGAVIGGLSSAIGQVSGSFVFHGIIPGILAGGTLGGLSGGLIARINGGRFNDGFWQGAIFGAIGGGIGGYMSAKASAGNLWWGGAVKHGRTQWSFFTSEKPYASNRFSFDNANSGNLSQTCGPSTVQEADSYFGGDRTFEESSNRVAYKANIGTDSGNVFKALNEDYNAKNIDGKALLSSDYMEGVQNSHDLISIHGENLDPNSPLAHWDNIRQVDYYSTKVVIRLRIGSFTYNNNFITSHNILIFRLSGF